MEIVKPFSSRKSALSVFLASLLLLSQFFLYALPVLAATSPWSESPNFSLTKQEKLTNTGFETDTSSWTAAPKEINDASFVAATGAVASWPLDDTTATQSYARVVNPADSEGRNIVIDGGFETWTSSTNLTNWTEFITGSSTITQETTDIHSGSSAVKLTIDGSNSYAAIVPASNILTVGKTYTVTFWAKADATVTMAVTGTANYLVQTLTTTYTQYTTTFVADNAILTLKRNVATGQSIYVDDVTVTQLNIPATPVVAASELLSDGDMEADGTSAWTAVNNATLTKYTPISPDTAHGGTDVIRVASSGVGIPRAQQAILTVGQTYRITGYTRSEGNLTPRVQDGTTAYFTGTTSTSWQPFDVVVIASTTNFQIGSSAIGSAGQYVEFDDISVTLDTSIRQGELVQDNDMEDDNTNSWLVNSASVLSKQTTTQHDGSSGKVLRVFSDTGDTAAQARQNIVNVGKRYRAQGWVRTDGSATAQIYIGSTSSSVTATTSWTEFDKTILATGTSGTDVYFLLGTLGGNVYTEWDDVSLTEISPLVGANTNGVTVGSTSDGHLTNAYTFDGSNDVVNIYSTDLNSVFNPSTGTLLAWAKVSASSNWTDGSTDTIIQIAGSSDSINMRKNADNTLQLYRVAGGTTKAVSHTPFSSTDFFMVAISWDQSADEVKAFVNGSQVGSTLTGIGTWTQNLGSTGVVIGAANTSGLNPWSGMINDVRLYNSALSPTEIANLYSGGTATRDTGTKYAGTASSKLISYEGYDSTFVQSVNVGTTETYQLEAYAYTDGSAVTDDDVELYYGSAALTTSYTPVGGGWYKLTGTLTGANEARDYGVIIKADKTVYVDDFSLWNYPTSDSLTSSVFDSEITGGAAWGTLTYTSSGSTVAVKVRTSNSSSMSGASDFGSCTAISSGSDVSSNSCVTDGDRYAQYEVTLSTSNQLVTPTLSGISLAFGVYDSEGPSFVLDSPGDNTYTNSERPTFRWKAASDSLSTVTDYDLVISPPVDSGKAVLVISDIPVSRTTDYETAKYVVHYDGFEDADPGNNYISVYTKSSSQWSNDTNHNENDGKLVEGKTTWSVKAADSAGNETSHSRTLLVDRTAPNVSMTSINNVTSATGSFATNDTTPTLKIAVSDPTVAEVSSGPSEVKIQIEKKSGLVYLPVVIYTHHNPASTFEYTTQSLDSGTYRIILAAKDKAGNSSGDQTYYLQVGSYTEVTSIAPTTAPQATPAPKPGSTPALVTPTPIASPAHSPTPEPEVTVPFKETGPSFFHQAQEQIGQFAGSVGTSLGNLVGAVFAGIGKAVSGTVNLVATIARGIGSSIVFLARGIGNALAFVGSGIGNIYSGIAHSAPGVIKTVMLAISNAFADTTEAITTLAENIFQGISTGITRIASASQNALANATFAIGQKAGDVSHGIGTAIIKIGYLFVPEPTTISNVKVASSTPTSMTITWDTNHPANGKVNYGLTPDYGQDVQTEKRTTYHEFTITGLTPNTAYHYEVMSQNRNYVYDANHIFTTPAE